MRILHFSDVHIGVESYSQIDPDTGLSTRLLDFLATFDEVVNYAIETRVDLVLFCGDAYKSRDPNQTHQREFAKRIARLSSENIPCFLVVGNHDMPYITSRATALEIFRTLDVPNIHSADSAMTYRVETASGPVQIVAMPWIRRSSFLAREDTRGMTPEEVNDVIQRVLSDLIRARAEELDPGLPALFAGHITIGQAKTSSEVSMMLGHDHILLKSDVALPQFDYVALGHIHRHQILGNLPHVVYSGSLERIDFGEENDEKGFCVIDLDLNQPRGLRLRDFEFRTVAARPFLTIPVEIKIGDADPTATVIQTIERHHVDGSIVRIDITLPGELEGLLRDSEIRNALDNAQYVASISRHVIEETRTRLGGAYTKTLEPREALKRYLENRKLPKDRFKVLMKEAENLMEEVEDA